MNNIEQICQEWILPYHRIILLITVSLLLPLLFGLEGARSSLVDRTYDHVNDNKRFLTVILRLVLHGCVPGVIMLMHHELTFPLIGFCMISFCTLSRLWPEIGPFPVDEAPITRYYFSIGCGFITFFIFLFVCSFFGIYPCWDTFAFYGLILFIPAIFNILICITIIYWIYLNYFAFCQRPHNIEHLVSSKKVISIRKLLHHSDSGVRDAAIKALGKLKDKTSAQSIRQLIRIAYPDNLIFNVLKMLKARNEIEIIASTSKHAVTRKSAVTHIVNQKLLLEIAAKDTSWDVRKEAIMRISDDDELEKIFCNEKDTRIREAVFHKVRSQSIICKIAKEDKNPALRSSAVLKIHDNEFLAFIVQNDKDKKVQLNALQQLSDKKLLLKIAENKNIEKEIRAKAYLKIGNQEAFYNLAEDNEIREAIYTGFITLDHLIKPKLSTGSFNVHYGHLIRTIKSQKLLEDVVAHHHDYMARIEAAKRIENPEVLKQRLLNIIPSTIGHGGIDITEAEGILRAEKEYMVIRKRLNELGHSAVNMKAPSWLNPLKIFD